MRTLAEVLRWRARRHPRSEALRQDGSGITWAELDERTSALAAGLVSLGIEPGDRVAILDKNSAAYIELLLATAKAGAVATPVNWRLVGREVAQVVDDAGAALLVVGEEFRALADSVSTRVLGVDELPRGNPVDPRRDRPEEVVWQLYTSGTTGLPKGAMLTHANLYAAMPGIAIEAPEIREGARALVAMPLYHIGGCGWALAAMWAGCTCVVVRDIVPDQLVATIVEERINAAFLVPAVLLFLSQVPGVEHADFSALQRILYGASPITTELLSRCLDLFGCRFTQVYGLTETTGAITALRHEDHAGERLLSCGQPGLGVDVRIVDPEGHDLSPGEVGELWVRTEQNMRGYWHREAETAEVFADGWLRTGDACSVDGDGFLYVRDRVKDMIVTGGENVYPIEVENVLAEHPDVADVAVIGVPHPRWGETVKAIVVRRPGSAVTEAELIDFCRPRLAGYKRPTSVDFVATIPRNPTGKVLKRELREPYWAGHERRIGGAGERVPG